MLVGLIVVVVDPGHLAKLNKLDLAAKHGAEALDCVPHVNLFKGLDVDVALYILAACDRQYGKRAASLSEGDALVDQTHAYLALKAALHAHLPELGVIDRGLPVLSVFLFLLVEFGLTALLVLTLLSLVLDVLKPSLRVKATL